MNGGRKSLKEGKNLSQKVRFGLSFLSCGIGLVAIALLVFSRSILWGEFVFEDFNRMREGSMGMGSSASVLHFRPIVVLSYWLQSQFEGAITPHGSVFCNVLLHALNTLLLYVFLTKRSFPSLVSCKGRSLSASFGVAILFAVNPIHTEAIVSGMDSGRAELLAFFFGFLGILAFSPQKQSLLPWVLFFLAALSKESGALFPVLAISSSWFQGEKPSFLKWIKPFCVFMLMLFVGRLAVTGAILQSDVIHFVENPLASLPFEERLFNSIFLLGRYLAIIIVPFPLSADYSFATLSPVSLSGASSIVSFVFIGLVATIFSLGAFMLRTRSIASFALLWFFLAFILTANILFPIETIFAERLAYTPSVAGSLLLGWFLLLVRDTYPRSAVGAFSVVVIALTALTIHYQGAWQSKEKLIERQVALFPNSVKMQVNLAVLRSGQGHFDIAEEAVEKALSLYPASSDALLLRARLYAARGDNSGAKEALQTALFHDPLHLDVIEMFVNILLKERQFEIALPLLDRGLSQNPFHEGLLSAQYRFKVATENLAGALEVQKKLEAIGSDDPDFLRIREQIRELMREKIVLDEQSVSENVVTPSYPE
ncbi:hypothetical protein EBR25_06950 [bacterium]|nr:hypothetical protein [bacterium]